RLCAVRRLHPLLWSAGLHLDAARRLRPATIHLRPAGRVSASGLRPERLLLALSHVVVAAFPRPRDHPQLRAAGPRLPVRSKSRAMSRYRRMCVSPTAHVRRRTARAAAVAMAALALAGCSSFGYGQPDKPIEPNVVPADYKGGLISFLQNNPSGLIGAREAALSPPELKAFGNESRYVACVRVAGPDWRKDKMIV